MRKALRRGLLLLLAPTGKLSRVGGFRADTQVVDLAIPLDQG